MLLPLDVETRILIGPFVDETNGYDIESGLTIAYSDVSLSKNGTAFVTIGALGNLTNRGNGFYEVVLGVIDLDVAGNLIVTCKPSGARVVRHDYYVGAIQSNITQILSGDLAQTATDAIADNFSILFDNDGEANTITLDSILSLNRLFSYQLVESYPASATLPVLSEALAMFYNRMTNVEISGTTLTVKRVDGSTTAFTLTLDDTTNPTSITKT